MSFLGGSSPTGDPKAAIMGEIRQQFAIENARLLVEKVNEHCFERCIPKPGSSLSRSEETCFSQCMQKYVQAWDTVSRQYINKIQQNSSTPPVGSL